MKSHVRVLTKLAICVYKDAMAKCAVQPHERDMKTVVSRVEDEGLSFLTITLPTVGADLEKGLRLGYVDSTCFKAFRKASKHGAIPAFLQGMLSLIFDSGTGRILDDPSIAAIEGVRQVAYTFKKLRVACTPHRMRKAMRGYIEDEQSFNEAIPQADLDYFHKVSRCVWGAVLSVSALNEIENMVPRHGPGATEERASSNSKYKFLRWHDRLEPIFPMMHWAFSSESAYASKEFEAVTVVTREQERPVRVTPVPKTLKAPRIIAIEPTCMQYAQQALSKTLIRVLESNPLTRGHLNYSDQKVNRKLAIDSSRAGDLATLDLSSASDRVPAALVYDMLEVAPVFREAAFACRSETALISCEGMVDTIVPLRKFASMGSALCFPIESMYFYTICIGALLAKHNLPVTFGNVKHVSKGVFIFGDDILVPSDDAAAVCDHLQKYYCKVNIHKSFWTGKFRESCGMDAYDGEEVTPTYLRETPPTDRRSAKALISWTKTSNLLYKRGYWLASDFLLQRVEAILGELPLVTETCSGLGKVTFNRIQFLRQPVRRRINKSLQAVEIMAWRPSPVYRDDSLGGYNALLKCLLLLEQGTEKSPARSLTDEWLKNQEPEKVSKHLERTVRYGTVTLKRRWTRPW